MQRLILAILALSLFGCGYGFTGGETVLPPDIKTVYVPRVENSSTEAGLTSIVTDAFRDRLDRDGTLTVVDDIGSADVVLLAKILKVERRTRTVTSSTDTALQMETTMNLSAELKRTTGASLWRNRNMAISRSFGTTPDVVVTSSSQFAESGLGSADLASLDSREIARGQEQAVLASLADEAAQSVYDQAIAADF